MPDRLNAYAGLVTFRLHAYIDSKSKQGDMEQGKTRLFELEDSDIEDMQTLLDHFSTFGGEYAHQEHELDRTFKKWEDRKGKFQEVLGRLIFFGFILAVKRDHSSFGFARSPKGFSGIPIALWAEKEREDYKSSRQYLRDMNEINKAITSMSKIQAEVKALKEKQERSEARNNRRQIIMTIISLAIAAAGVCVSVLMPK